MLRGFLVQEASFCSCSSLLALFLFCKHQSLTGLFCFNQNLSMAGWTSLCSLRKANAFITRKHYFESLSFSRAFERNLWQSLTTKMEIIFKNNLTCHHFLWTHWWLDPFASIQPTHSLTSCEAFPSAPMTTAGLDPGNDSITGWMRSQTTLNWLF